MIELKEGQRLSQAARRLLDYIEQHPSSVLISSAVELAQKIDASDATVIRAVQSLGFEGLPHLKSAIAEKLDAGVRSPVEKVGTTVDELIRKGDQSPFDLVLEAYSQTLPLLACSGIREDVDRATRLLTRAGRIGFHGAGPSFRLAQQTATHLLRTGFSTYTLSGSGTGFADSLLMLRPDDVVVMLAFGKAVKEARLVKAELARIGGRLLVVTDNPEGQLAQGADALITVPRTEVGNMTLYGTTLLVLEAVVLSLTKSDTSLALETARRLQEFRLELSSHEPSTN